MVRSLQQRWVLTTVFVVLAAMAVGVAAEFHHTDDGCRVETHCVACMNATVLRAGLRVMVPVASPSFVTVGRIVETRFVAVADIDAPAAPSRAPPLA